jgi:uncharacterized protein YndB with AHSA1/START domain
MKIIVSTVVPAPVEPVWQAYTTAEDILQWNAASSDWHTTAATLDLRPAGTFSYRMEAKDGSFGFDFAGEYTQVLPLQRIEYQFGDRVAQVVFRGVPEGTAVEMSFDPEQTHSEAEQRSGWQAILDNFRRHVVDKLASA